jgi:outer membrane protein assembly factor BamB
MTRPRRYLLIAGLLLIAVLLGLSWQLFRLWRPNFFDAEMVDAEELDKVKGATLTAPPPAGPDWPQYRGPNRDGIASADHFNTDWTAKPPKVAWKSPLLGKYGSVAVADGRVYVQGKEGDNERLICLKAADGKVLWADDSPADYTPLAGYSEGPRGTPTIHDGRAYTAGALGQLRCVKLNGDDRPQPLWEKDLRAEYDVDMPRMQWGFASSPLVEGDLVIVQPGGKKGAVVAFDRVNGEPRWAVGNSPGGYSSPVAATLDGVRQVLAVTGDSIVGVGVPDGKKLWEYPWRNEPFRVNAASPVVAGEFVFVSSEYDKGCVLLRVERGGGKPVFFKPGKNGLKTKHSTAVHRDGFVYGSDGPVLKCMSLREGKLVADWEAPARIDTASVVLVGDTLLAQDHRGGLFLIDADPTECRVRWELKGVLTGTSWATPAVVNGRIYTRDAANVVCIDAGK